MFFSTPKSRIFQNSKISDFSFLIEKSRKSRKFSHLFFFHQNFSKIYFFQNVFNFFLRQSSLSLLAIKHSFMIRVYNLKKKVKSRQIVSLFVWFALWNSRPPLKVQLILKYWEFHVFGDQNHKKYRKFQKLRYESGEYNCSIEGSHVPNTKCLKLRIRAVQLREPMKTLSNSRTT